MCEVDGQMAGMLDGHGNIYFVNICLTCIEIV